MADRPGPWIELKAGDTYYPGTGKVVNEQQACKAPPKPEGRVVAKTVQIDVRETLDLHTGYAREGWHDFLWLSGWRAAVAVFVLRLLSKTPHREGKENG